MVDELNKQLVEYLKIGNHHDRQTAVLLWWDQLSTIEQDCVRDEIMLPMITHIREIWDEELSPILQIWGECAALFLSDVNATIKANPELAYYIERLEGNK